MLIYLTRKYDVGEGTFKKKTPIELATKIGNIEMVELLQMQIKDFENKISVLSSSGSSGVPGGVEKLNTDRVKIAKARLEAFRAAGQGPPPDRANDS